VAISAATNNLLNPGDTRTAREVSAVVNASSNRSV
jgi:hypothetical protein